MAAVSADRELLQDFLTEARELLDSVDNQLVELERSPADKELLNAIFRGFHTVKGGAGFLNLSELVKICHRTETLFDQLRNGKLGLTAELMDLILAATGAVRGMFDALDQGMEPRAADPELVAALENALQGAPAPRTGATPPAAPARAQQGPERGEPDWAGWYETLIAEAGASAQPCTEADRGEAVVPHASFGRRASDNPANPVGKGGRRDGDHGTENNIRVDTTRLDLVLNLAGEIGLTKNRLNCLRSDLVHGTAGGDTLRGLDEAVNQLNLLVGDLQNAVMKTRMQPVGRMFQKYPRMVRDIARQLSKSVKLDLIGEDTEVDKTMIEELSDPLVHLIRNAVDHGIESEEERLARGKSGTGSIRLSARQAGDRIVIQVSDDGRGMRADVLRRKAIEKGLLTPDAANAMDDQESLQLIFLPGLSTKEQASSISGRGVGMDVVKTNIQKVNGRVEVESEFGVGTTVTILLPLTLAILPVLMVRLADQVFAVPLTLVREIIMIDPEDVRAVSGSATMVVREEVLPIRSLTGLLGWEETGVPGCGVLLQSGDADFVLAVDGFVGREDLVVKPLDGLKPRGVAGATLAGDGSVVLVLDIEELLRGPQRETSAALFERQAA